MPGRPKGSSVKITRRVTELSALLSGGLTVAEAAGQLGLKPGQADYCAELLHKHLLETAVVLLDDVPIPAPPAEAPRMWQDFAACRGHGDLFFSPEGELRADRLVREAKAATLCRSCPVQDECLDLAYTSRALGWWAGTSEDDRKRRRPAVTTA